MKSADTEPNQTFSKNTGFYDTQTSTSSEDSCRNSFKLTMNNFPSIKAFNSEVLNCFIKSYYPDFIAKFQEFHVYEDLIGSLVKKSQLHFRIYPLVEYLSVLQKNHKRESSTTTTTGPRKVENELPDNSIVIRLIKQLLLSIVIFIDNNRGSPDSLPLAQLYPVISHDFPKIKIDDLEQLQNAISQKVNVMVVELLEVCDVFCFLIPMPMPKPVTDTAPSPDQRFVLQKTQRKDAAPYRTFNEMLRYLEDELNKNTDPARIKFDAFVPPEIRDLLCELLGGPCPKEKWGPLLMECLFMERSFPTRNPGFSWTVNRSFLFEYSLLVQISRMLYHSCVVPTPETNKNNHFDDILKNQNRLKAIFSEICKENKGNANEFLLKNNDNYVSLINWISEPDFMLKLLLLDPEILKVINPQHLIPGLTPLKLFYLFLNDQVPPSPHPSLNHFP